MANCVIVLGESGSGKSTSIKGLNPKETVIINILGKKLPFRGSNAAYSKENKNFFQVEDYVLLLDLLDSISRDAPHVKNVVIDDAIYIMRKEYFKRAKETGFNKFVELAQHFQQIISKCEAIREDLNLFLMLHTENVVNDKTIVGYKAATIGQMIDDKYNPIEVVPMLLFSSVLFDEKGKAHYGFYTHTCMEGAVKIPAKTPDGMFEEDRIPNDLGIVVDAMNKFYNGQE